MIRKYSRLPYKILNGVGKEIITIMLKDSRGERL